MKEAIMPFLEHKGKRVVEEGLKLAEKQTDPIVRQEIELYVAKVSAVLLDGKTVIDLYKKDASDKTNDILDN